MLRRLPLLPTLIVAAGVAVMIGLGIWQLGRAAEKEDLLARYRAAQGQPPVAYPTRALAADQLPLFRSATGLCLRPTTQRATAGRNRSGEVGYVHIVDCVTGAEGPGMSVELGWSRDPKAKFAWNGGLVSGTIAPDQRMQMRLVAASAPPGLQPSAPPSPDSIPNNHRSYAFQWFAFAAIALLIYALAVRGRLRRASAEPAK